MKNIFKCILLLSLSTTVFEAKTQTYVNREWVNNTSAVNSEINRSASVVSQGSLFVTSNILTDDGDTDVLTIAYDSMGDTLWLATESGTLTDGNDYGVNIAVNPAGDIVVVSAIENLTSEFDYAIYQYDKDDGTLIWSAIWNGIGN